MLLIGGLWGDRFRSIPSTKHLASLASFRIYVYGVYTHAVCMCTMKSHSHRRWKTMGRGGDRRWGQGGIRQEEVGW